MSNFTGAKNKKTRSGQRVSFLLVITYALFPTTILATVIFIKPFLQFLLINS